jgi:hypothetical protein
VDKLDHAYKGVHDVLAYNTAIIKEAANTAAPVSAMASILDAEFDRFKKDELRHAARTNSKTHLNYRLHWSGDVFDVNYARALRAAMSNKPDIEFWTYTRSFFAVRELIKTPNLILYLSLDPVNVLAGLIVYEELGGPSNPNLQLCYMSREDDFDRTRTRSLNVLNARNKIRESLGMGLKSTEWLDCLKLNACPVDAGKMSLELGCSRCKQCITPGTNPILFTT